MTEAIIILTNSILIVVHCKALSKSNINFYMVLPVVSKDVTKLVTMTSVHIVKASFFLLQTGKKFTDFLI